MGARYADLTDSCLLQLVRDGDVSAYGEVFRRHRDAAIRYARRLAPDAATADDLVSDAFLRVLQAMQNGRGPHGAFRPYLFAAVRSVSVNFHAARERLVLKEPDEDTSDESDGLAAMTDQAMVARAFASLPTRWVTVKATVPASTPVGATDCTPGSDPGTGFLNAATVTTKTETGTDDACAPVPNVSMTKDLVGTPVVNADGTVSLTYKITVTNAGAGSTSYDLADQLTYGKDISVVSAAVRNTAPGTIATNPSWNGRSNTAVAAGVPIAGAGAAPVVHTYEVTVKAKVGTDAEVTDVDCAVGDGESGTGFLNQATVTVTVGEEELDDDACGPVDPKIAITKDLVGQPVLGADGRWTVTYDIKVANTVAPNVYDLTDGLHFGAGIKVESAAVANTTPGGISMNAGWNGLSDKTVAMRVAIGAGVTHTYRVTVTATVPASTPVGATDCTLGSDPGTGFLNTATVTTKNQTGTDDACAEAPNVSMTKDLVATPVVNADGTVSLTYKITVRNTGAGSTKYDLADELTYGQDVWVLSAAVKNTAPGSITTDPAWDGTGHTAVASNVPIAGASSAAVVHTYEVTVKAKIGSAAGATDTDCALGSSESGTGFLNQATVTVDSKELEDDACGEVEPKVAITKDLVGRPQLGAGGRWTVTYDIKVANTVAPNVYDLTDGLHFGAGIKVESAAVANTAPGGISTNAGWNGLSDKTVASRVPVGAGVTHTYRVTVTATVPPATPVDATDCTAGSGQGTGFLNAATVTTKTETGTDDACAPVPNVSMTKDLLGDPVINDDNTVSLKYQITVRNGGAGSTSYDLADQLTYGKDITVLSASVKNTAPGSITTNPGWDGIAETAVSAAVPIAGADPGAVVHTYEVTVKAKVGTESKLTDGDCTLGGGETGTGFLNRATVTVDEEDLDDDACGGIEPELEIIKELSGKPTVDEAGNWTIDYDIEVRNTGPAPGEYDLDDELQFGAGVTIVKAAVANSAPGGITTNPAWNGTSDVQVTDDTEIAVGATHTYRVSVTAKVPGSLSETDSDCTLGEGEGGSGFFNEATLALPDDTTKRDDACAEIPSIGVVKTIVGTPAVDDQGNIKVTYRLTVTNQGKGEGIYDLSDTLTWGQGLTVSTAKVTGTPDGFTADTDWDGRTHPVIAVGVPLAGGSSHIWTVEVTGRRTSSATATSSDCILGSGEKGTGLLNTAGVTSSGQKADSTVCSPVKVKEDRAVLDRTEQPRPFAGTLPRTGATIAGLVVLGIATLGAGVFLLGVGRRRRPLED
ncbi:MAG: hypothetical protein JWO77_3733 [Ilumatobacteraceae bacterium]|nr:hypothetical protein [Ilumatobacteraceae bacterium]